RLGIFFILLSHLESDVGKKVELEVDRPVLIRRECNASSVEECLVAVLHEQINGFHCSLLIAVPCGQPPAAYPVGECPKRHGGEADQQRWYSLSRSCLPQLRQRR